MSHGSPLRDENVAAIDNANSACSGICRAAILKGRLPCINMLVEI